MQLDEYFFRNRKTMTVKQFAPRVELHPGYIGLIANKRIRPSLKVARRIEKETNGEVTVAEIMEGFPEKKKKEE